MAVSHNQDWSETTFDRCVDLLNYLAKRTGLTYRQVNVIIFCYIWPGVTVGLATAVAILLKERLR